MITINHPTKKQRGSLLFWILPAVLLLVFIVFLMKMNSGVAANQVGKPAIVKASQYGRVETVLVKVGDVIKPGQDIAGFTVLDPLHIKKEEKLVEDRVDVTITTVKGMLFDDTILLPGIIQADTEVNVPARVAGTVKKLHFQEGQKVKKGDKLISLDENDYQIALEQANAVFVQAELTLERVKQLTDAKAGSKSTLDEMKAAWKNAKSTLDMAELNLSRCTIYSPLDGIVDAKMVEEGEFIHNGDPVARMVDIRRVRISIGIPEQDISYIKKNSTMHYTVPSLQDKNFSGVVDHISLGSTPLGKVYPMQLLTENQDAELLPGMFARVKVIRKNWTDAVMLPIFSIIPSDDEYYTFIEKNGIAEKRILTLGTFQGREVHILKGLAPGDRVINKGLRLISPGGAVRVIEEF